MSTLKEEINREYAVLLAKLYNGTANQNDFTNEILSIIEKRLDSVKESNKRFHEANLREVKEEELDKDEYYKGYMTGKFDILDEIKEMLK